MKKFLVLAITTGLALAAPNVAAFSGSWGGKGGTVKGANEHAAVTPQAKPNCVKSTGAAGGQTGGAAGGVGSGSSEHSSVRGTINGGGDFIAPKLQPKVQQPRSVSPKLRAEPPPTAADCR
ncbi:MAG: hypothetical protein HZB71_03175 [Betaproteobacteria bacterium]|nr:hypothetical protein [Betaproteobacteria bacterium]